MRWNGSFSEYLEYLLSKYRLSLHLKEDLCKNRLRVTFQDRGLNLIRYSYRPFEEDYQELKTLSLAHGVSINLLIVYLIEMDQNFIWQKVLSLFWKGKMPPQPRVSIFYREVDFFHKQMSIASMFEPTVFYLARGAISWSIL
ncbi:PF07600 family protein [Leptospira broomii serovar Hurstbridge str. 5399]|uniref:PF07600 family protein n=1 Tax=Leptospira broomii serovar Hurstbridge str. 5399 TaxID=1049789 RepID=T0F5X8_9LEPT|nr:PF07600 family protein [Leptospira broomii serovar Hurstbridge str. 5399]